MAPRRDPCAHALSAPEAAPARHPRSQAFADLKTWAQVEAAAPWAQAIVRIEDGPSRGTFCAFECPQEARTWAKHGEARA